MDQVISRIGQQYHQKINSSQSLAELDTIYLELFGKNGQITLLPKQFASLPNSILQKVGPLFNQTKSKLEQEIESKRQEVREARYQNLISEKLDLKTTVELKLPKGKLHPLTVFEAEISNIFSKLGFCQFDAPEIDSDYNNFQVLNIPEGHPARDLQDTFYLDNKNLGPRPDKLLLRTHTSNSQVRIMRKLHDQSSIRIMSIGRCFRYENLDARHEHTFDQFELICVEKGLNLANLQYLSEYYMKAIFGPDVKARLRPKYYPFVEPGAGIDGLCVFCKGQGCRVCGGTGWLELGGAGMIHPQVLLNGGYDPKVYSGIAWGTSPDRMVMLKYGISDIRLLRNGDLKFLQTT